MYLRTLCATLVPALLAAQTPLKPTPLTATLIYHVPPDSARATSAGAPFIIDRAGTVFIWRTPVPTPTTSYRLLPMAFSALGIPTNAGPDGAQLRGVPGGWVGKRELDSLWIESDSDETVSVLGPDRRVARVVRTTNPKGPHNLTPHLWVTPGAIYPDGTVLVLETPSSAPPDDSLVDRLGAGTFTRVRPDGSARKIIMRIPWPAQCYVRNRLGKNINIPWCATPYSSVSPSGGVVTEAFVEFDKPGFTVVSVTANGDTNFRKHFVLPTVPVPNGVLKTIIGILDTALARATFDTVRIPRARRDFGKVIACDDGTIWIAVNAPGLVAHGWIEIDRKGKLVGQVVMPVLASPMFGSKDELWGLEQEPAGPNFGIFGYRVGRP